MSDEEELDEEELEKEEYDYESDLDYKIENVAIGTYSVTAAKEDFGSSNVENITIPLPFDMHFWISESGIDHWYTNILCPSKVV